MTKSTINSKYIKHELIIEKLRIKAELKQKRTEKQEEKRKLREEIYNLSLAMNTIDEQVENMLKDIK